MAHARAIDPLRHLSDRRTSRLVFEQLEVGCTARDNLDEGACVDVVGHDAGGRGRGAAFRWVLGDAEDRGR
jgi:hypothetical protein